MRFVTRDICHLLVITDLSLQEIQTLSGLLQLVLANGLPLYGVSCKIAGRLFARLLGNYPQLLAGITVSDAVARAALFVRLRRDGHSKVWLRTMVLMVLYGEPVTSLSVIP